MSSLLNTRLVSITADTLIKSGGGYLKTITITNVTAAGTLTIYDSLTATGTILSQVTLPIANLPVELTLEGSFTTGCFIDFDATLAGRVTVAYA